jgi:hypothetical protein
MTFKTITIITNDTGKEKNHTIDLTVATLSQTIKNMIDDIGDDNTEIVIPMSNIDGKTIDIIFTFCNKYKEKTNKLDPSDSEYVNNIKKINGEFEDEFISSIKLNNEMSTLIQAVNFLDIEPMLNILLQLLANQIKKESPKDIFNLFDKIANEVSMEIE